MPSAIMNVTARDEDLAARIMQQAGADIGNPYVVLAVGANWPNKRWPTKYFAALSDWLYSQKLIPVVIGGGVLDASLAAEIEAAAEIPPVNLVGRTSLKQLAHIIRHARLTLGGDTGPVHLSAGIGTKTVMVMGPTDANRNGPYGQLDNAIEAMSSKGWRRRELALQTRQHDDCIVITVADRGPGMTPDCELRAFEPFFTTKRSGGRHLGTGLSRAYQVVTDHGGFIDLAENPGGGCLVTVEFRLDGDPL